MMRRNKTILLIIMIAFVIISINARQNAGGNRRDIFVFCTNSDAVKDNLKKIFEKTVFTTQHEKMFNLIPADISEFQKYEYYHNHIFLVTAQEYSELRTFLYDVFDKKLIDSKFSQPSSVFYKDDLFADDARSLFILGKDYEAINEALESNPGQVYDVFNSIDWLRTKDAVYFRGVNDDEVDKLKDYAPFLLDIPETYWLRSEKQTGKYNYKSWWIRGPDRILSVMWVPGGKKNISKELMLSMRQFIARDFFDGDSVVVENAVYGDVSFAGLDCKRLASNWRNDKYFIGGCFRSYAYYDEKNDILYFIDLHVQAPGKKKEPLLRQLEVIGATFRIK